LVEVLTQGNRDLRFVTASSYTFQASNKSETVVIDRASGSCTLFMEDSVFEVGDELEIFNSNNEDLRIMVPDLEVCSITYLGNAITGDNANWITVPLYSKVYLKCYATNGFFAVIINQDTSGGVQSVTGTTVNNSDPSNPVVNLPTLQQILNNNHDLVNGINLQGTDAGSGNTGTYVIGIGANAAKDNSGNDVIAIGKAAAESNTEQYITAVGIEAAKNNSGLVVNAFGSQAASDNSADFVFAFGEGAGRENTGTQLTAFGNAAGFQNGGNDVTAIGFETCYLNTGDYVVAIGSDAGISNSFDNVNIIGRGATVDNNNQTAFSMFNAVDGVPYNLRLDLDDFTNDTKWNIRPIDGTPALLSDLAGLGDTPNLQQVTDVNNETTNEVVIQDIKIKKDFDFSTVIGEEAGDGIANYGRTLVGFYAGKSSTGERLTAFGDSTGYLNTGGYVTGMGANAVKNQTGSNVTGLGFAAGLDNVYNQTIHLNASTSETAATADNQLVIKTNAYNVKINTNVSANKLYNLPTANTGTFALTSDIPNTIVGIAGTMSQFDTAVTDGNFVYQSQALGTPASGNLANCTFPTLNQNTTGTAANVTASSNTSLTSLSNLATVGTIATGVWHGTAVGSAYGGTGLNTSSSTGIPQVASGTWSVSTALAGGTTATTQASGDNSTKVATTEYIDRKLNRPVSISNVVLTGVTSPTVVASLLIPANTYVSGDTMEIFLTGRKSTTAGAVLFNVYHDTSLNGTSNVIASGVSTTTTNRSVTFNRYLTFDGTTLNNSNAATSALYTPFGAASASPSSTTCDPTVNNYITFEISGLTVGSESATILKAIVRPLKL